MKKIYVICILIFSPTLIYCWKGSTHKLLSAYACINSKLLKDNLIWKLNLDMGAAQPLFANGETKTVSGWISNIKLLKIEGFANRKKLVLGGRK